MTDSLGISEAQILGLFLSSVFWGMLLITFVQVMKCFLWDNERERFKSASKINWFMLIVALLLMTLSTLNVALELLHCIEAFILYTGPGGSNAKFTRLKDWVNILNTTCNIPLGKVISDGVLIYRCWAVCNHSISIIIFPILLWMGYLALAIFVIYMEVSAGNTQLLLTGGVSRMITASITAACTMSLVNNIITTGMIVYRIRDVDRSNVLHGNQGHGSTIPGNDGLFGRTKRRRTKLQNVIRIVIESGMMYTTIALITFITFVVGSNSFYATSDVELQILSIAFNLIIIRISTRPGGSDSYSSSAQSSTRRQPHPLHKFTVAVRKTLDLTEPGELDSALALSDPSTPPQSLSLDVEKGD
ncbi:hypothetical protein FB446DRAFT_785541 [Lentinula raphanica]|nr:hypothetical protein FB446DRAFT_785541 [Lentinula raphanica]